MPQVEGRVGGSIGEYLRLYSPLLRKLSGVLGCCDARLCGEAGRQAGSSCSLEELPSAWDPDPRHWYTTFSGPLYAGKYFAEWIELTMLNGMDFAWGRLSVEEVRARARAARVRVRTRVYHGVRTRVYHAVRIGGVA